MKKIFKFIAASCLMASVLAGCTGKFEEYNKSPYDPTAEQMGSALLGTYLQTMQEMLVQGQQNNSQMVDQMIGSEYGGYISCINPWGNTGNFYTLNPRQGWIGYPFDTMMPQVFTPFVRIKNLTHGVGSVYAWAQLLKVYGAYLLNGMYGPIAYTEVDGETLNAKYDSEEELFNAMFADLDAALAALNGAVAAGEDMSAYAIFDYVYGADFTKWVKFGNTLKLRMAMRISNVAPELAKAKAEEAVNSIYGVLTTKDESAWSTYNDGMNPYYRAEVEWNGGELRLSANVSSYLGGYADPRLTKYAKAGTYSEDMGIVGVRNGIKQDEASWNKYKTFSCTAIGKNDPLLVMSAAEAYFLRAEGALKGWNMGGTAKELYEAGVTLSMAERGVEIGNYLSSEAVPAAYTDLYMSSRNAAAVSSVTPKYDEAAGAAENLERILVQKWIASFPNGWERWGDFRRTGYPKMFPVVNNENTDGVSSERGMRRIPYSTNEYNTNETNVREAVANYLGGQDTGATDLWWAKKN